MHVTLEEQESRRGTSFVGQRSIILPMEVERSCDLFQPPLHCTSVRAVTKMLSTKVIQSTKVIHTARWPIHFSIIVH